EDELRAVLRLTTGSLDSERGFFEVGLDSLMSVELKTRLEKRFGTRLPATLTFNYPTVAAVAEYLHGRIDAAVEESVVAAPSSVEGGSLAPEPQGVAAVAEAAELEGGGDADDG